VCLYRVGCHFHLVGCTNSGKSSLFNSLLMSDLCKEMARDKIGRATISTWPGMCSQTFTTGCCYHLVHDATCVARKRLFVVQVQLWTYSSFLWTDHHGTCWLWGDSGLWKLTRWMSLWMWKKPATLTTRHWEVRKLSVDIWNTYSLLTTVNAVWAVGIFCLLLWQSILNCDASTWNVIWFVRIIEVLA